MISGLNLLNLIFGRMPDVVPLGLVFLVCWGLVSLGRWGQPVLAAILFLVLLALEPVVYLFLSPLGLGGDFRMYLESMPYYLAPWCAAGAAILVGLGISALAERGLRWAAALILGFLMILDMALILVIGFDGRMMLIMKGWGLQYLDYLTPVALAGLLAVFPLHEASARSGVRIVPAYVHWPLLGIFLVVFMLLPLFAGQYLTYLAAIMGITMVSVLSLNLLTGFCGQLSLAQAALMGIGGYTAALLSVNAGLSPVITVPLAGITAAFFGVLAGLFSFLRPFWLGLITLAGAALFRYVFLEVEFLSEITGGPRGLVLPPAEKITSYVMIIICLFLILAVTELVSGTRLGRILSGIRDNPDRPAVSGYPYKLLMFTVNGFFAGLAGGVFAHHIGFIAPDYFNLYMTVTVTCILIIGGMGTILGPILAVILVMGLQEIIRTAVDVPMVSETLIVGLAVGFLFIHKLIFRALAGGENTGEAAAPPPLPAGAS